MSELSVLVVDDNIFKSINIKRALVLNGIFEVKLVDNQEEAWDFLVQNQKYNLVVTDIHYPLKKGLEADYNAGFILIEK